MHRVRTAIESQGGLPVPRGCKPRQARRLRLAGALLALLLLVVVLSPTAASAQAPLLKDNGKLAFVSFRDGDPEIYTMNADGTEQVRLTNNPGSTPDLPSDFWPSWSPDGAKIVFSSDRGGANLDLYTMNPDGTGLTRITSDPAGDLDPALSPDGTKIVFVKGLFSPTGPPAFDIDTVNVDGTGEANLTKSVTNETEPAFSPDGKKIVFERDLGAGNHEIYIMNADGTGQTRLTNTPNAAEGHPNFSPDGTKIVFDDNFHAPENVAGAIYTMNVDGTGVTPLTANRSDRHGLAAFSPDGTKITFTASEDIWTMNADGSNQIPLTSDPAPDIQSSWQPTTRAASFPPPAGTSPPPDTTNPILSSLSTSPTVFRAAGSGASITRRKVGTRVSYRLSEAATTTFGVERAGSGRRSQGKCLTPRRSNRKAKKCTRYVTLSGSFTHRGKAGQNSFHFSARLRGHRLAPGRYRLRAFATDAASNSSTFKRKYFRIVRR